MELRIMRYCRSHGKPLFMLNFRGLSYYHILPMPTDHWQSRAGGGSTLSSNAQKSDRFQTTVVEATVQPLVTYGCAGCSLCLCTIVGAVAATPCRWRPSQEVGRVKVRQKNRGEPCAERGARGTHPRTCHTQTWGSGCSSWAVHCSAVNIPRRYA